VSLIFSAWGWLTAVLVVLFGFPFVAVTALVTAPFDPGRYAAGRLFRLLAVTHVTLNPLWRFRTEGARPPDPRRPYVVVSNHESYADIFLLSHLPWEMKWLSKETIFRIPVMGWMMRLVGDIPVRRGERSSGERALRECADRLSKRVSIMIFPEGTRSPDDRLLPFRKGAFRLAIEAGVPILPIVVAGTRYAMAKGSFRFQKANARARVLEPIETIGLTIADANRLAERTREAIESGRAALRAEMRLPSPVRAELPGSRQSA
jgi:1-acyl-sn-glycerol-3-phosphate acyltransferase